MPRSVRSKKTNKQAALQTLSNSWWLLLIQGIITVLTGIMLIFGAVETPTALVTVLGFYWLVVGLIDLVIIFSNLFLELKGMSLFGGVLSMITGLGIMNNAIFVGMLTPTVMNWLIALVLLGNGVLKIFIGNQSTEKFGYDWSWSYFLAGILYLILGIVLLGMPIAAKFVTMVFAVSILTLIGGIGMVIMSLRVRTMPHV